jgi:hypothetical protein
VDHRGDGKLLAPVIGLSTGNKSEVLLDPLVGSFSQSVSLGVEGSRQVLWNSKLGYEGSAKMGGEMGVSVSDDLSW